MPQTITQGEDHLIHSFVRPGEKVLFVTRIHLLKLDLQFAGLLILIVVFGFLGFTLSTSDLVGHLLFGVAFFFFMILAYRFLSWRRHIFVVTDHHVYERKGLFIETKQETVIRQITNHEVKDRLLYLSRILNFGDIYLYTANNNENKVLRFVANAKAFDDAITDVENMIPAGTPPA